MMKENEAKNKWCPFADFRYGESPIHQGEYFIPKCISSGCMAWIDTQIIEIIKDVIVEDDNKNAEFEERMAQSDFDFNEKTKQWERILDDSEKEGYCQRIGNDTK